MLSYILYCYIILCYVMCGPSRGAGPDHLCSRRREAFPDLGQVSRIIGRRYCIRTGWPCSFEIVQAKVEVDHVPGETARVTGVAPNPVVQTVEAVRGIACLLVASCRFGSIVRTAIVLHANNVVPCQQPQDIRAVATWAAAECHRVRVRIATHADRVSD